MASLDDTQLLSRSEAENYATWFSTLGDPTRVVLLHAVATTPGELAVGTLAQLLGISQSTCSHHVRRLAASSFLHTRKAGTTTLVSVNEGCCTGLPHAADLIMGGLATRPCCPEDLPADVQVRELADEDWTAVRRIYAQGLATRDATCEEQVPSRAALHRRWLPAHRWVAEIDSWVVGWASVAPISDQPLFGGIGEVTVFVRAGYQDRGVGKTLLHHLVNAADANGLWTLQATVLPENRAALNLFRAAGFRTLGAHDRYAPLHGQWRDTIALERRRSNDG